MNRLEHRVDFPITPEWDESDVSSESGVLLASDPAFHSLKIPPTPARAHLETKRVNHQLNTAFTTQVRSLLDTDEITAAFGAGWVLSLQQPLDITPEGGGAHVVSSPRPAIQGGMMLDDGVSGQYDVIMSVRLFWVPLTDQETSLLITHPPFVTDDRYRTLTQVIDTGYAPQHIDVPVLFNTSEETQLPYGRAIAQITPLSKRLMTAETHILPPDGR